MQFTLVLQSKIRTQLKLFTMKKNVFLFSALLVITLQQLAAQNVGIGTTTPTQKLDVAGNVNISGTIMANGTSGTPGQVLTSTSSGLTWSSIAGSMGYKKCVMFFDYAGSASWTVPSGVSEVMVELWGGGSGGTTNVGGSSGTYARCVKSVVSGEVINFTIGDGSAGATQTTDDGGTTTINFSTGFINAPGGGGITVNGYKGTPRILPSYGSIGNAYFMRGNVGEPNINTYGMKNSTTYVETIQYGIGGAPVGMLNSYPFSGDFVRNENGNLIYRITSGGSYTPSAGGAAGWSGGWKGGKGMVIIWFN